MFDNYQGWVLVQTLFLHWLLYCLMFHLVLRCLVALVPILLVVGLAFVLITVALAPCYHRYYFDIARIIEFHSIDHYCLRLYGEFYYNALIFIPDSVHVLLCVCF